MKALFIISSHETGAWLSEITHPHWHLTEGGVEVDFASPAGGKVVWSPYSDPYFAQSMEAEDIVSKGFLSDKALAPKLDATLKLRDVELSLYDVVHVAGGQGATFDLFPNQDVAKALEHFWSKGKVVGAICHGVIALANNPERLRGRRVTGFTLEADKELEFQFGSDFILPNYPQTTLEDAGAIYSRVEPYAPYVVVDGKLVTGENQQSSSEYAIALLHAIKGRSPVVVIDRAARTPDSSKTKALFLITSHETGAWLSEITHPYWHFIERGIEVDFASPAGGKISWSPYSDPHFEQSLEKEDIVSKGFLSDRALATRLDHTLRLQDVDLAQYALIHLAGGQGTTFDFFPSPDVARTLEHFWSQGKVVGAICHGAIGLANNPERLRGRRATGFTLQGDQDLQEMFGPGFILPHYPQTALEKAGAIYSSEEPYAPHVVVDGKLVTGTNQQSASEYAIALLRALAGGSSVKLAPQTAVAQEEETGMRALFVITSHDTGAWLSEITHPYWHLIERGVRVDFASPAGGKIVWSPYSDPYFEQSMEKDDIVSKGFLSDAHLTARLNNTLKLKDVDLKRYDAVHLVGGQGTTFDFFPSEDLANTLEHFWANDKVIGAICHGAIGLANNRDRLRGRRATGFTLEGDQGLQATFGSGFVLPHYPQTTLEEAGAIYSSTGPYTPHVVIEHNLVTGTNQQSASEYAVALFHAMSGSSPVSRFYRAPTPAGIFGRLLRKLNIFSAPVMSE